MAKLQDKHGLEDLINAALKLAMPMLKSHEDDVNYLESELVKQDARFRSYAGSTELRDYLSDIIKKHRGIIYTNKVAETLDRLGALLAGEEIVEIPLKGLLYLAQAYKLLRDKNLNVSYGRLARSGAKYAAFEFGSLIPFIGELFDVTNIYYKEYMKSIASGIKYEEFARRQAAMSAAKS
ncbi:hypothetical protein HY637_02980 [Candidatus Woesearchaeota archaeon]|nr:hypothetical protein [Candidatus Woesearchaeota archaeon]